MDTYSCFDDIELHLICLPAFKYCKYIRHWCSVYCCNHHIVWLSF